MKKLLFTFYLVFVISTCLLSQTITGLVYSNENIPIPFAHIYVKNIGLGTTSDEQGKYNLKLQEGSYEIIISSLGYKPITFPVVVYSKKDLNKNFWLEPSLIELEQGEIKANRRDPAYEIIQNAIKAKKTNFKQVQSSKCDVYIKAKEVISEKEKKKREQEADQEKVEAEREGKDKVDVDPAKAKEMEIMKLAYSMNMVEIKLERHYQYPNNIKEIRQAYEKYGYIDGLFYLSTAEAEFNFYQNLLQIDRLNVSSLISPLNATSIISYKFKLEKTYFEFDKLIYHIKVTPRKQGEATFDGYIDIIEGSFAIRKIDLSLHKGGLLFYDDFRVQQEYELVNDSIWLESRQEFDYKTKSGNKNFTGKTTVKYSNYEIGVDFPKRYFKNELAVTSKEAYERDSTYWKETRPEPLSIDEQRIIFIKDSIYAAHNKKEYLDSLDKKYNRVTWGDVLLWGIGNYNRAKNRHIWIGSLPSLINFFNIGGTRIGPNLMYYKKFENEHILNSYCTAQMGIRNLDVKGNVYVNYFYNPFKHSSFSFRGGKSFSIVQANESIVGFMDRSNYVESTHGEIGHRTELFNGFFVDLNLLYEENKPIDNYEFGEISEYFVGNNTPRSFEPYQQLQCDVKLQYTPFQKFMTEPKRKIILGSDWPTFTLFYKKGVPTILGSDINFDYLEFSIKQSFRISTIGTSTYKFATGKFLNTSSMRYENHKIFPRSDKWFFSTPMQNQLQEETFITDDLYFEAHYVHHFNGAIVNNIPLLKKLRIYTLGGINYTWITENNYHYIDMYFGIEKSFRIQRQLFRLGVYLVFGGSNNHFQNPNPQFNINSYDIGDGTREY